MGSHLGASPVGQYLQLSGLEQALLEPRPAGSTRTRLLLLLVQRLLLRLAVLLLGHLVDRALGVLDEVLLRARSHGTGAARAPPGSTEIGTIAKAERV